MSTKIYNGYKLPLLSVKELNEFVKAFREKAVGIAKSNLAVLLANEFIQAVDNYYCLKEEDFIRIQFDVETDEELEKLKEKYADYMPLVKEYRKMEKRCREIKRTNLRDPEVDFECELVFIPLQDKILALFYAEQKEFQTLWEEESLVSYYGYWNNTDPDEDCTEEEWDQRRTDWNEALPGIGIPFENGLVADIIKEIPRLMDVPSEEILSNIPSLEARAKSLAKRQITQKRYEELLKERGDSKNIRYFADIVDWLKTTEAQEQIKEKTDEISVTLLPSIEKDQLRMTYKNLKGLG